MPLSDEQRAALPELRAQFARLEAGIPFGSSMPFDKRADIPTTGIPDDITVRVEIAPPSSAPLPLFDSSTLKKPEPVPIFFYSLRRENPAQSEPENTKVIFFTHGGGNVACHPTEPQYITFFAAILRALATSAGDSVSCTIIAPCYRLATVPENECPAALQDILAAYDFVISQGYNPSNVTIAGDSAGGNHALVLTHLVLQSNRPVPNGVVAVAPASLHTYNDFSEQSKAQASNDVLPLSFYHLVATAYIRNTGFSLTDPLISGSLIPFTESWPKTLILVGTSDHLLNASRELKKRLEALNRPVELVEYDERPHAWWIVMPVFSEDIQDAAQRIARLVLG